MVVRHLQHRPLCFLAAAVCPLRVRAVQTGDPWARRGRSGLPPGLDGFSKVSPLTPALREAPRDLVVVCHGPEDLAQGAFKLNNLPKGRVDVLARCVSSAIFLSHGVREQTRIWLQLQEAGVTLCLDGGAVKGMHPDERSLAAAMKRTLSVAHGGATPRDDVANGWSTRRGSLGALLAELQQQAPRPLLQLHEQGSMSLEEAVAEEEEAELRPRRSGEAEAAGDAREGGSSCPGAILVFGDQLGCAPARHMCWVSLDLSGSGVAAQGSHPARRHRLDLLKRGGLLAYRRPVYADTAEEDALIADLGGRRVTCSPRGLLTSHCIVLCHHTLDAAESRAAARVTTEQPAISSVSPLNSARATLE